MLKSLKINNFQTHRKLALRFSPGVTSIIGATDSGKSAVVRALRWVALNTPGGTSFIRHGASEASVTVCTQEGKEVTRARGKSKNSYEVDGDVLKAFRSSPPETVLEALNLGDLNFQEQHEAPFWFSLSAGEVSRRMNAIVDLSLIDRSLAYARTHLQRTRSELAVTERRKEAAEGEVARLAKVDEVAAKWASAERIWEAMQEQEEQIAEAESALRRALALAPKVARLKREVHWLENATKLAAVIVEKEARLHPLEALVERAEDCTAKISARKKRIAGIEERLHSFKGERCPLCGQTIE